MARLHCADIGKRTIAIMPDCAQNVKLSRTSYLRRLNGKKRKLSHRDWRLAAVA